MDCIKALEKEISDYFGEELQDFCNRYPKLTEKEALKTWADRYSAIYNTPSYINEFVEKILEPKFGITYQTLQETLRSSGITFTKYVESLMETRLQEGTIFKNLFGGDEGENQTNAKKLKTDAIESSIGAEEGALDDLDDSAIDDLLGSVELKGEDGEKIEADVDQSADTEEKSKEKKSGIIKNILGNEDIDLSDEDSEELDSIMGKLSGAMNVTEKVCLIRDTFREKDTSTLQKLISKGTGMTLDESKTVLELLDV